MSGREAFVPFGQGHARGMDESKLGSHGAGVDALMALGLPVVTGLTLPVGSADSLTEPRVAAAAIELLEQLADRRIGVSAQPLLIRLVASAPAADVAGVPPDLPGIGVTAGSVDGLNALIGGEGVIYSVYRAAVRYVGEFALDVPGDEFADLEFNVSGAPPDERLLAERFVRLCAASGRLGYPEDPAEQLALAAQAVLNRWQTVRARRSRRSQGLPDDLGLALHVQALRIGRGSHSGHGEAESRDPTTGAFAPTGVFRRGVRRGNLDDRPGEPLTALPSGSAVLTQALRTLEHHLRGVARVEFEVRDDGLALLTASRLERPSARAVVRNAVELADAKSITDAEAVSLVRPEDLDVLLNPQLRTTGSEILFLSGLPAAIGAATGRIALTSERAVELEQAGEAAILVATETSPGDLPGMLASSGIVTARGGLASHAAVVARGLGRPAICGAVGLTVDLATRRITFENCTLAEGDQVSIDGAAGRLYVGAVDVVAPDPDASLDDLLRRADGIRTLGVRANADTGREAARAVQLGAEGIGLCRTEHQFLGERLPLVRRFLLATDPAEEAAALIELAAAQREDFTDLLRAMGDRPVTVRLLDAPLHEFLGDDAHETNPMLGLRGVRLALLRPELYPAQARALFEAWAELTKEGLHSSLEVMIPLVALSGELSTVLAGIHTAAEEVSVETGISIPYLVGTMVETPRAALVAGQLAEHAQFLSFGTNDLTQLTFGFSRDDVEASVLVNYVEQGLLKVSPFASLDSDGVGRLIEIAIAQARAVRPGIKLGLCGEQGGDPASIRIGARLGLDYVSCSPTRLPGARLAAAHAALEGRG